MSGKLIQYRACHTVCSIKHVTVTPLTYKLMLNQVFQPKTVGPNALTKVILVNPFREWHAWPTLSEGKWHSGSRIIMYRRWHKDPIVKW